mgnify:CR=1 FL=1
MLLYAHRHDSKVLINISMFIHNAIISSTRPSKTIVSNPKYCNCRAAIIPAIPAPITIIRDFSFLPKIIQQQQQQNLFA